MAITTAMPTSCKEELLRGVHNFGDASASPIGGNTFKLALIRGSHGGTYGAANTNYSDLASTSPNDEATDSSGSSPLGYKPGGGNLTNAGATTSGTTGFLDFADLTFTAVTLTADGCMIYNSSAANEAVYVGDFGGTKTASGGDFVCQFPTADSSNAIIRLA